MDKRSRELAGLVPDVTPHTLKHTCATLMLQNGVSTWTVAGLLGTSEAVICKVYGHHAVEHLRSAADHVWSRRPESFQTGAVSGAVQTGESANLLIELVGAVGIEPTTSPV